MQECCHCREIINYSVYNDIILVDHANSMSPAPQTSPLAKHSHVKAGVFT